MVTLRKQSLILAMAACCLGALPVPGALAGSMGVSDAEFLRLPASADAEGMGGAYSAWANGADASFWNPAGLATLTGYDFSLTHALWLGQTNYEYVAYGQALRKGAGLGAHVIYYWVTDFNETQDDTGQVLDAQAGHMQDLVVAVSTGFDLGWSDWAQGVTWAGVTMKYLRRELMDQRLEGLALDAGVISESRNGLRVAILLQNFGANLQTERPPFTAKLGIGWKPPLNSGEVGIRLGLDLIKPLDLNNPDDHRFETALGVECAWNQNLFFRLGYQTGSERNGLTAGLGIQIHLVQLDYAYVPFEFLGPAHHFSLSLALPK